MSIHVSSHAASGELSVAELDAEVAEVIPQRLLMRHHRSFFRHSHRFNQFNRFNRVNHFNRFNTFGFNRFGSGRVSNFNSTSQFISNPQVAVNIGGGHISQFGGNTNFNSNVQFGF